MAKKRIVELEKQLAALNSELLNYTKQSDSPVSMLSYESLIARQKELAQELTLAKRERGREIVEFRLLGKSVDGGAVPLFVLAKLSQHISGFVLSGIAKMKTGKEMKGPIPSNIIDETNLRLAGLSKGSARLYIVGNSNVDLFGFSLLEDILERSFQVLSNENENLSTESVSILGRRSIRHLTSALQDLETANLEIDLEWENSRGHQFLWNGNVNRIAETRKRLGAIELLQPEVRDYIGTITLLSRAGRIEIRTESNEIIRIYYPQSLLNMVSELHLGQVVSLGVSEVVARNILTGAEKGSNELIKISWVR